MLLIWFCCQPYKCNKKWVVALNPLPHCGSGSQADGDASCDICKRRLNDPTQYRYCSVACKVEALSSDAEEEGKEVGEPGKRKHRRKGVIVGSSWALQEKSTERFGRFQDSEPDIDILAEKKWGKCMR
ncbi:unnamed protein product [Ilex paraguariensis]|uniref:Uncharacterized protein n=1 Tax=Ilex paraguariensis TaxID=185542 RepID=A0ABC8TUA9_9AQUA